MTSSTTGQPAAPQVPQGGPPLKVLVLNGPNLGRLGIRQPEVYGSTTLADVAGRCADLAAQLGVEVEFRQTDSEAEMLGWVHAAADARLPVVLNAGAWTHTSVALRDACAELPAGLIELHISNVHAREPFRHHSYLSDIATGVVAGLGTRGYELALRWLAEREAEERGVGVRPGP